MLIGHINLDRSMNGTGEHFVRLVEGLNRQGVRQHVLVANRSLARRVAVCEQVRAGPVVRSWIMACCLMPDVDVVHVHDRSAGRAGLVLKLTRSIPYVVSRREAEPVGASPIGRSIIERASGVICPTEAAAASLRGIDVRIDTIVDIHCLGEDDTNQNRIAAEHVRIYRRGTDTRQIPVMLL